MQRRGDGGGAVNEPQTDHGRRLDHGRLLRDGAVIIALLVQFGVFIWQASRVVTSVDNLNVTMREVRKDLKDVTSEMVEIKVDHAKLEAALSRPMP